jgi:hypothetical protein
MAFVELRDRLHDLVYRYGLFETLDRDHFYDSVDEGSAQDPQDPPAGHR